MIIDYFLLIRIFSYKILHNIFLNPQELGKKHSSISETKQAHITSVRDKLILIIITKVIKNALSFKAKLSGNLIKYLNKILGYYKTVSTWEVLEEINMKANLNAVFLRFLKLHISVVSKNSDLFHRWKNKAIICH